MSFTWMSWNETQAEAAAAEHRAESEARCPEGQGYEAVFEWRKRQIRQITEGFASLDNNFDNETF